MRPFRDLSIGQKLTRVAVLASAIALMSAAAAFVAYDVVTYRAALVRRLATDADIIAANSVSALVFQDQESANGTVDALRAEPHVMAAAIYDATGRLFVTYERAAGARIPDLPRGGSGHSFTAESLVLFRPIVFDGRPVGTVVIESDLGEMYYRLRRYVGIVALVSVLSLLLSLAISSRLQAAISGPLLRLADTARRVSRDKDYSARVSGEGKDEVGQLIGTFNEMLARIQERDSELQDIRSQLEKRVEERTEDLRRELAERRRAEQELKKSELLLAEAQRVAHFGSWEWDVVHGTLTWSEETFHLFGRDAGSFTPTYERLLEAVHPDDRARFEATLTHALEGGRDWSTEYRLVRPDGTTRHMFSYGNVIADQGGRPARMIGTSQDITDRKAAEEERTQLMREQAARADAESEQRRSAYLAEVGAALVSSLDDRAVLATLARVAVPEVTDWCVVLLCDERDRFTPVAAQHRDPAQAAKLLALSRHAPPSPTTREGVLEVMKRGEGRLFPVVPSLAQFTEPQQRQLLDEVGFTSGMLVPLRTRNNTFGVLAMGATGERRFSYRDLSLAQSLADRGALATDNARLYGEAQEANRMKDEFLATLSHELRTPLNAIVGWAKLLQGGQLDEATASRAIDTIDRNARVQTQLIEDILDVSRIVAGKLNLNIRSFDLRTVIEAALDSVRHAADAKGVGLETRFSDVGKLPGDPDRLQQVVWNLVSNAIKFTSRGGWVRVGLQRDEHHATITVEDNGVGIPPAFLPHVFERFRQADSSSTRPHGGLGLGLAIVRHLVELHGGTAEVESEGEGKGARFAIHLPLAGAPRTSTESTRRPAAHAEPAAGELLGVRVLVVEDEADARELIRTMLEQLGAVVTTAASADEAMVALDRDRPDVLLSDIEMPGSDGYDLIKRIRARPADQGGAIPSAALTAYARNEDREAALEAGFQQHIPKPVKPTVLAAVVSSLARQGAASIP